MNSTDTQQSLKHRVLLAISAGALLAAPGCGGNTSSEPDEAQQRGSRDTSSTAGGGTSGDAAASGGTASGGTASGGTASGGTASGGTASEVTSGGAPMCSIGSREFCLTTEVMEAQARYGFGQIPRDPPRTDAEVAAGYDANGCMRNDWVATSCCNPGLEPGTRVGDQCCYTACEAGCCGRPLVLAGQAITAPAVFRGDWVSRTLGVLEAAHPTAAAATLAASWQAAALAEHASVASFARFTLQLLALGAPHELVRDAQLAALDEIDHAKRCFEIASRLSGRLIGPGELSQAGAGLETDWAEVVVATIHEGCVGETLAAALASEQARVASVPEVRDSLLKIAADEARHAELAWRFVAWALQRRDERVCRLAAAAFGEALARLERPRDFAPLAIDRAELHAWGQLSPEESEAVTRQTAACVVGPAAHQLLASVAPGRPQPPAVSAFRA